MRGASDQRLIDLVDRIAHEHPPIDLADVDLDVVDAPLVAERFGHVLDYLARVELEVDRNVLEIATMLPDPPDIDVHFYRDVWQPQEVQHGLVLDRLQVELGRPAAEPDRDSIGAKLRVLGALAHLGSFQDVCRMLYYLTGMATERSAVLAYNLLHDGLTDLGERALATTVVVPIRRQEPGHYAFYQLSARALWAQLAGWQRWLVRRMRTISFAPVGANDAAQRADFGDVMASIGLGAEEDAEEFARKISRVETELLWARRRGLAVPPYVVTAFREARELATARRLGAVEPGQPGRADPLTA